MQVAVRNSKIPIITAPSVLKVRKQNGHAFELAQKCCKERKRGKRKRKRKEYFLCSVYALRNFFCCYCCSLTYLIAGWCSWIHVSISLLQIGRSTESPIDFVVTDTVAGSQSNADTQSVQSTISRFACRIMCQRTPPYAARIYAAGFDSSKNIFLGVSCVFSSA